MKPTFTISVKTRTPTASLEDSIAFVFCNGRSLSAWFFFVSIFVAPAAKGAGTQITARENAVISTPWSV